MKISTPEDWLDVFLRKRELQEPDGRTLFKYKIKNSEFNLLKVVLEDNFINTYKWEACFVIYASECWRRKYSAGPWAWDVILGDLNKRIKEEFQNISQRNSIVKKGLNYWRRQVYTDAYRHNDYLSTIILECGLPEGTLSNGKHWLTQLIIESYKELSSIRISEHSPTETVAYLTDSVSTFPNSLKKEAFFELISQITLEAISLKRLHRLGEKPSPTDYLNTVDKNWRTYFPVAISDTTQQFIDQLLTEVAKLPEPHEYKISIEKELIKANSEWKIKTVLGIPDGFYDYEDLHISKKNIPLTVSKLDIELTSGSNVTLIGHAFKTEKKDKEGFRINGLSSYTLSEKACFSTWKLILSNKEHDINLTLPLPGGEALEDDVPWVFEEKEKKILFRDTGSLYSKSEKLIVIANQTWPTEGHYCSEGKLNSYQEIYQVNGKFSIKIEDQLYTYKTKTEDQNKYTYVLQGSKLNFSSQIGKDIYLGLPVVFKIDRTNLAKIPLPTNRIQIRSIGEKEWESSGSEKFGYLSIRLLGDESEVLFFKKIIVLPRSFSLGIQSNSPTEGKILLNNSEDFKVCIEGENLEGEIQEDINTRTISVKTLQKFPPKKVSLLLIDKSGQKIKITLPFPSQGVKFFDKKDFPLSQGQAIYLNDLYGHSIVFFNSSQTWKIFNITFGLNSNDLPPFRIIRRIKVSDFQKEVALINFKEIIEKLLACSEDLDAEVKIRLITGDLIKVKRYSTSLSLDPEKQVVSLDGEQEKLQNTVLNAFRFDESLKKQVIVTLTQACITENRISWKFAGGDKLSGKWLIFPSCDSAIQFRPRLWIINNGSDEQDYREEILHIWEASVIKDTSKRIEALTKLAFIMSSDFDNPNWNEVRELYKYTKHLPLNTFDVWTAFTRNEDALISLFFNLEDEFVDRLSNEYPILWEAIPVKKWLKIGSLKYENYKRISSDLAQLLIETKLEYIEERLRLKCLTTILRNELFDFQSDDLSVNLAILSHQIKLHMNGDTGFPGLKNRKIDENWPDYLTQEVKSAMKKVPDDLKNLFPEGIANHRLSVIFLPTILAASTANINIIDWNIKDYKILFHIKEIQEFDEEWFYTIYDLIQGYCWVNQKHVNS